MIFLGLIPGSELWIKGDDISGCWVHLAKLHSGIRIDRWSWLSCAMIPLQLSQETASRASIQLTQAEQGRSCGALLCCCESRKSTAPH
jgi:hypothetical protein